MVAPEGRTDAAKTVVFKNSSSGSNDNPGSTGGYFSYDPELYKKILDEAQKKQALIDGNKSAGTITDAQAMLDKITIRANSFRVPKGTQVYLTWLNGTEEDFTDKGYTVTYAYYRSINSKTGFRLMFVK